MALKTLQVTIGAAVTQFSTTNIPCYQVIVQNNSTHTMRIGDKNTSATRGALLAAGTPGGSVNLGTFTMVNTDLMEWWVAGTQNDVVDVIYIAA